MKPFIIPWRKHSAITCESSKYYGRTLSCEGISPSFGASLRCTWVNLVQISRFVHQIVFFIVLVVIASEDGSSIAATVLHQSTATRKAHRL